MWTIFDNIKYLYSVNAYDKKAVAFFVENDAITKEQYRLITGDPYPYKPEEPTNINVHTHSYQATIEAE